MKIYNLLNKIFSIKNEYSNGIKHKVITIFLIKLKFRTARKKMTKLSFNINDKCLVIAPHPDDESIGMGGVLLSYSQNFDVIVLSDGRYGGILEDGLVNPPKTIKQRAYELKNAMEYIGISHYTNLQIEDKFVTKNLNLLKSIDLKRYDYIFVPNSNEAHPDHKYVLKAVRNILKWSIHTKILSYEVWTPLINPNIYFNINHVLEKKINLLKLYESQIRSIDYVDKILGLNCYRGTNHNIGYAECFNEEKTFLQMLTKN